MFLSNHFLNSIKKSYPNKYQFTYLQLHIRINQSINYQIYMFSYNDSDVTKNQFLDYYNFSPTIFIIHFFLKNQTIYTLLILSQLLFHIFILLIFIFINMIKLFVIAILFLPSYFIIIPLAGNKPRCMIAYTMGNKQTIKLQIKFPPLPNFTQGQGYDIYWKNTETQQVQTDQIVSGFYKKQIQTVGGVIYEVCFKARTRRDVGKLDVQYSAMNEFYFKQQAIVIPENLLKSEDLHGTYQNGEQLKSITARFIEIQEQRSTKQQKIFEATRDVGNKLELLSLIELGIIFVAAVYQVFALRNYLVQKNYV